MLGSAPPISSASPLNPWRGAALVELGGFRLSDLGAGALDDLWVRGGLPRAFLAADDRLSAAWRDDYIRTFLERHLAALGSRVPATTMRRFWTMVIAHYHGRRGTRPSWPGARGVPVDGLRHLDALTDALVIRQLQPWFANLGKRQVRSPKVYVRDSGLLHRLLGIAGRDDLLGHPKVGASWEGFVIEQILQQHDVG